MQVFLDRISVSLGRIIFYGAIAICFVVLLLPIVMIVWSAFVDSIFVTYPANGYTLRWFAAAVQYPSFISGFLLSIQVAAATAVLGVAIGCAASLVLVRRNFIGREFLNSLVLSPLMVPNIILGVALYLFFIWVSDTLGLRWIAGTPSLIIAHLLLTVPYSVRLISATLTGVNRSTEEAAANLGARPFKVFRHVTVPQIRPGIAAAALFSFIISFENVELSLLLVGPGSTTLPIAMMQYLEFNMDPTVAAASALKIALIGTLLVLADRFVNLSKVA
jgi:putative spermidine/putrescine transport system permease protein